MTKNYLKFNRVAFDIGNVLFHFDPSPFLELLIESNIVNDTKTAYEFIGGSFQNSQELGLYNIKQSFYQLNTSLSDEILQKIHDKWMETFHPSLPMIDFVHELIEKGYSVALLSNIGPDHAYAVRNKCDIFKRCIQHFSCDIGARKPTRLYFQSFIMHYGWQSDVKYFDDKKDNIVMGKQYLNGIQFDLNNFSSDEDAAKTMRSYFEDLR